MNPHFRWLVDGSTPAGPPRDRPLQPDHPPGPRATRTCPSSWPGNGSRSSPRSPATWRRTPTPSGATACSTSSIAALRRLNALGYGRPGSGLLLNLVYNPVGPSLPPPQAALEAAYRRELDARYGIVFNRLYTITNMPISRFLDDLVRTGQYERYMETLVAAFNPAAVPGVMCRTTLSVGWDGRLFDCDFNQMLELGLAAGLPRHIRDFDPEALGRRPIVTGQHCYGCTAGSGSSCQGALV